jgi:hypothetical protein
MPRLMDTTNAEVARGSGWKGFMAGFESRGTQRGSTEKSRASSSSSSRRASANVASDEKVCGSSQLSPVSSLEAFRLHRTTPGNEPEVTNAPNSALPRQPSGNPGKDVDDTKNNCSATPFTLGGCETAVGDQRSVRDAVDRQMNGFQSGPLRNEKPTRRLRYLPADKKTIHSRRGGTALGQDSIWSGKDNSVRSTVWWADECDGFDPASILSDHDSLESPNGTWGFGEATY